MSRHVILGSGYRIAEVCDIRSPYLPEMESALREVFPILRPCFGEIIAQRLDDQGRIRRQIFVGLCENQVAGLMQIFYHPWRNGLVGNVDLLGILELFRSTNLGIALMRHAITATLKASAQYKLPVAGIVWLTEQDDGPPGSWPVRRVRMFQRLGGQVRRDLCYRYDGQLNPDGELIFWYPLMDEYVEVETKSLIWLLWQFGGLPEEEFVRRYGDPEPQGIP